MAIKKNADNKNSDSKKVDRNEVDRKSVCNTLIRTINRFCCQELYLVLKTHVAEYRRKPLLNLGFILSLATATTTLLCILVLNHASKQQYQQANEQLTGPIAFHIVAEQGGRVNKKDFAALRKRGFTQITPTLTFRKKLANGKYLSFRAIDMLALSISMPEQFDSEVVLLTQAQLDSLSILADDILVDDSSIVEKEQLIVLADKTAIPFRITTAEEWVKVGITDVALLDIALAWQLFPKLFPQGEDFSYLMVAPLSTKEKQQLMAALPPHLSIYEPWSVQERQGFADALHLNLSALAILGFVVSMFIAFQAGNQAWNKRSELAAQLRLLGVQLATIKRAMLVEALFLIIASGIIGIILSVALVMAILPLLGLTLNQLYSLNTSGHFDWQWQYAFWAFIISSIAVLLALMKQFKRISSVHVVLLARGVTEKTPRFQTLLIAAALLLLFILWPDTDWYQIMFKYGLFLIASVALLPNFLQVMLYLTGQQAKSFRFRYIIKDASCQIKRRYLPLAAFYLALSTSITAALMVNSFELAFIKYLDQQLSSDLFIRHQLGKKQRVENWLDQKMEVDEYVFFQHTWGKINTESVRISIYQSPRQLPALRTKHFSEKITTDTSENIAKSVSENDAEGCYINEQLALKKQLSLAETITLTQGGKRLNCEIKGIYYQYGNPGLAVTLHEELAQSAFSGWVETGFGVFFNPGYTPSKQDIVTELGVEDEQVYEPKQIKKIALNVFAQTFVLTQAIAAVLLAIACFGLFLSANSLELARKSDLYILRSLGYSKIELFAHMLMQWLLLAIGTILLSWPVATILANALVSQALPASFGWSMPLMLNVAPFVVSSVVGLLFLLPALSIPLLKLNVRSG